MAYETINYSVKDNIATLTLDRPDSYNAIDVNMREEILDVLQRVEQDKEVRVLVITGSGKAFSAGGDVTKIKNLEILSGRERVLIINKVITSLVNLEKPVIAAVNGVAVGAGCNLALAADIVIASEKAKFGQAFVKIGLVPDAGGSFLLPRLIGVAKAKELIFTGDNISAKEAKNIGLINYVTSDEEFNNEVNHWANKLKNGPLNAIGFAKKLINKGLESDLETILEMEANYQGIVRQTKEHQEGLDAFLNKRSPDFIKKS